MRGRNFLISLATLSVIAGVAHADVARVVIADSDPELQRAIVTTLAPWKLEVLVDPKPPVDIEDAKKRAAAANARFVVWRHGHDLLVFDRERDGVEQRATTPGTLDDARAAQAALTVKTLMRLPPPPTDESSPVGGDVAVGSAAPPPPPPIENALEIRLQAGAAAQIDGAGASARGTLAATVRPWSFPLRFGVAGDLGSATAVEQTGFQGDWSHWSVLALASWALPAGRFEIEPFAAGGITRSMLDGTESSNARRETEVLGTAQAGLWFRVPLGRFSVGGTLAADFVVGTPTYTKLGGGSMNTIFEVPGFSFAIGAFAAADFAP